MTVRAKVTGDRPQRGGHLGLDPVGLHLRNLDNCVLWCNKKSLEGLEQRAGVMAKGLEVNRHWV